MTILSVPWHDVIHCAQVLMFFSKASISHALGDRYSVSNQIPNMLTAYFGICFGILWRLASVVTAVCIIQGVPV
jgi:hypothetical protein